MRLLIISAIILIQINVSAQCADTLKLINFPCCISGMDWSEREQSLFLVSDLRDFIYKASIDINNKTVTVKDSLKIVNSPHLKGLEAIRKTGNTFYLAYEKDEAISGSRTAHAFISKAYTTGNEVHIDKTIEILNLPDNKGIEGISLSEDQKTIWISHETMAKPKNGFDSVKFINLDTNLVFKQERWYQLPGKTYFGENENAYNDYGVTEILLLKDSVFVLERGYGRNNITPELFINIFKVPLTSFVKSSPLYRFQVSSGKRDCIDNYEGMCYLPVSEKLLIISDDNNNKRHQRTILVVLNPLDRFSSH